MIHRGKIVKAILRQNGHLVTKLAKNLQMSRNTLYNRFNNPNLSYSFIIQIGHVIGHNFSSDFPEIKNEPTLLTDNPLLTLRKEDAITLWKINRKYIRLLEEYTKLLNILIKMTNQNEAKQLQIELMELIQNTVTV